MNLPVLRPYQQQCVADLRRSYAGAHRAPLLVIPTGAGKTVVFAEVTRGALAKRKRTLIVVHRRELLKQASAKLAWAGVPHGIIAADFPPTQAEQVQVASVQTLAHRLDALPQFDLIVLDLAHHSVAHTWRSLLKAQRGAKILGLTATPARTDGKGLGISAGGWFDDLVLGPDIGALVAGGFLSPTRVFVPQQRLDLSGVRTRAGEYVAADLEPLVNAGAIIGDVVEQYRTRANNLPAIAFCVSVTHAEREWSLAGVPKAQKQKGSASQAAVWRCDCGCVNPAAVFVCLACDEERPGRRQVESVPGDLAELTADRLVRARRLTFPQMMRARLLEAELREFARARGYNQGWVFHRLREQVVVGRAVESAANTQAAERAA